MQHSNADVFCKVNKFQTSFAFDIGLIHIKKSVFPPFKSESTIFSIQWRRSVTSNGGARLHPMAELGYIRV